MQAAPDWGRPWFADWREPGERVLQHWKAGNALAPALNAQDPAVRFVPQQALPAGTPYEQFIFDTRHCPARDNLHDFFNGLVWLRYPQAKLRFNEIQAAEIRSRGIGGRRGPVRDAITVFDENGALLTAPPELWRALLDREWRRAFVELRPLWAQARLELFGHAMLEQLVAPRKDMTVHVWAADCPSEGADAWLAGQLEPERLAAKPFTPLPVLGIPGWWPENANFSFYDDSVVFRPRRARKTTTTTAPAVPPSP